MANPLSDLYGMFNSMLKTPSYAETPASTTPADPRTGMVDPRITAEEERKRLLDEEAKRVMDEKRSQALKQAAARSEIADQPFKEQMQGQKVALLQQAGQGLEAQKAMQDPNYQLGSGSALRQRRGEIAPDWARMNRAARRLERKGYREQASQMAGMAEMARLGMPSINTQDQRNRMAFMGMEQEAKTYEKKKTEDLYDQYMRQKKQREAALYNTTVV